MNNIHQTNEVQLSPVCVGFIMDGNRRWARERNLDIQAGHKTGEEVFYQTAQWVKECHIPHAVFYAFSTENWSRDSFEVTYLNQLFYDFACRMLAEVHERQMRIKVIGVLQKFSQELIEVIAELEQVSEQYATTTIWIALSYGGRAEIIDAVNTAVRTGKEVTEETFQQLLWSAEMPDPDLIIRTGGDQRLSNFLPWQSVYSELIFTSTYWPAFTKEEFMSILEQYAKRQRRHGR